jgi:hypothetical protein
MGLALATMPTGALAQGDVWYVVTHSGKNILSFDTSGQPVVAPGETTPWPVLTGATLHDPRGFVVTPSGDLYLANAFKNDSRIVHFGPAAGAAGTLLLSRPCLGVFTQSTDSTQPNYSQGLQHTAAPIPTASRWSATSCSVPTVISTSPTRRRERCGCTTGTRARSSRTWSRTRTASTRPCTCS